MPETSQEGTQGTSQEGTNNTSSEGTQGDRTFSQADVDRFVQERLAKERKKYEGFEDLRTKAEQFDKLQEASKTELEKEREARVKAEQERDSERTERQRIRVDQAVERAASKAGFVDAEDAVLNLDRSEFTDKDGEVDEKELTKALEALAKRKPHLVGSTNEPGAFDGGSRGGRQPQNVDELFGKTIVESLK